MTFAPDPSPITNVKRQLKNVMIGLLLDLFNAEDEYWASTNPTEQCPEDKVQVRITKAWPESITTLPQVIVGLQNMNLTRYNFNMGEIDKSSSSDPVQMHRTFAYSITGIYTLDVTGKTATQRDDILEKLVEYMIWGFGGGISVPIVNKAGIDVWQYMVDRYVSLMTQEIRLIGESEIAIGQSSNLMYADGFNIPFYTEMFSSTPPADILEQIKATIETYRN